MTFGSLAAGRQLASASYCLFGSLSCTLYKPMRVNSAANEKLFLRTVTCQEAQSVICLSVDGQRKELLAR